MIEREKYRITVLALRRWLEAKSSEDDQSPYRDHETRTMWNFSFDKMEDACFLADAALDYHTPRPLDDWHEDYGCVLWWKLPVQEPPFVGTPLDSDWTEDYYTHWSPLPEPLEAP